MLNQTLNLNLFQYLLKVLTFLLHFCSLFYLFLFFGIHYQKKGEQQGRIEGLEEYYPKGFKEGSDFIIEEINKKIKEQGKDCTISVKRNDD